MKDEYDFSNTERGKFYRADTKINIPNYKETKQDQSEATAFSNHSANTIVECLDDKEGDV